MTPSIAEIYFLIRVGTWGEQDLAQHLTLETDLAYAQGLQDGQGDVYTAQDVDDAFTRGYDQGHDHGHRDGYALGHNEADHGGWR
jgi:hypothetical protein